MGRGDIVFCHRGGFREDDKRGFFVRCQGQSGKRVGRKRVFLGCHGQMHIVFLRAHRCKGIVRNMTAYDFEYTTTPELECMQACLREMLAWFHEWCKEHNLRYYVYGGTCLGAIRHSDIIPWDDDVDVAMPRVDFNRMREIMIEEGICADEGVVSTDGVYPRYVLETPKSLSGDFIYGYGKLYDTTTTLIEHARTPIKRGVFLDIFSLDGMG
ncbi:MAG: LicD family protein, partial [Eggerthellaceae bacterium]|nr:LicD family protein [Eggerthellaceae bacterium]